jgi:hypothetical protein
MTDKLASHFSWAARDWASALDQIAFGLMRAIETELNSLSMEGQGN